MADIGLRLPVNYYYNASSDIPKLGEVVLMYPEYSDTSIPLVGNGANQISDLLEITKRKSTTIVIGTPPYSGNNVDVICSGYQDTGVINSAIDALPANGGKIILLDGIYSIAGSIIINKKNVTIEGMGNSTIIYADRRVKDYEIFVIEGGNNCTIRNIKIDAPECVGILAGGYYSDSGYNNFHNCTFDCGAGIILEGAYSGNCYNRIYNNTFLFTSKEANDSWEWGVGIGISGNYGGASNNHIYNNIFLNTVNVNLNYFYSSISIEGGVDFGTPSGNHITGNRFISYHHGPYTFALNIDYNSTNKTVITHNDFSVFQKYLTYDRVNESQWYGTIDTVESIYSNYNSICGLNITGS